MGLRDGGDRGDHRLVADVEHGLKGQVSKEIARTLGAIDGSDGVIEESVRHATSGIGWSSVGDDLLESVNPLAEDEVIGALVFGPPELPFDGLAVLRMKIWNANKPDVGAEIG